MEKKISNIFKGDKVIWMVFFFLCVISIVEVFSASSGLTYKSNNFIMPIIKHSGTLIVGLVVTVLTLNVPCRYFKLATPLLLLLSLVLLVLVMFFGEKVNGASRQMSIMGISMQPSEIAKGAVILAVAQILSAMQTEFGAERKAFKFIMWITVPIALLIMRENLSTAVLLCAVVVMMMFIGRVPGRIMLKLVGGVGLFCLLAVSSVMILGKDKTDDNTALAKTEQTDGAKKERSSVEKVLYRMDTWKGRIIDFISIGDIPPEKYDLDKGAQVAHANIAIVSSNGIGKGPGNSVERDFLAQAFSDFIFAIIIEELGLFGATVVVFLYIVLLFRTAQIANRCENNFPAFFAMGLALLLVVQATFNMLVAVGWVPVTGQPLPLISKGGTSTIINCVYIGAILSISRSAKKKSEPAGQPSEHAVATA